MHHSKNHLGFSLLELMIAITIVSILTTLSFPLCTNHIQRVHRTEAAITLTKLASALEEYFLKNNTYNNANLEQLGFTTNSTDNHYHLTIVTANAEHYLLMATPAIPDSECGNLSLSDTGEKMSSGNSPISNCW